MRRRRRDRLPPLRPLDRADRLHPCPTMAARARTARRPRSCTRPSTTATRARSRPARARTPACGLMIGTTSVMLDTTDHARHRPRPRGALDAEPLPGRVPRLGRERARRQGRRARARTDRPRGRRARRPLDRRSRSRSSTRCSRAVPPGSGGVLFLPWLAGSLSPIRRRQHARRVPQHLPRHRNAATSCAPSSRASGHNLGWLLPVVERFSGHVGRGDRLRRRRGPLAPTGSQMLADMLDRPSRRSRDPHQTIARATALLRAVPRRGAHRRRPRRAGRRHDDASSPAPSTACDLRDGCRPSSSPPSTPSGRSTPPSTPDEHCLEKRETH